MQQVNVVPEKFKKKISVYNKISSEKAEKQTIY